MKEALLLQTHSCCRHALVAHTRQQEALLLRVQALLLRVQALLLRAQALLLNTQQQDALLLQTQQQDALLLHANAAHTYSLLLN